MCYYTAPHALWGPTTTQVYCLAISIQFSNTHSLHGNTYNVFKGLSASPSQPLPLNTLPYSIHNFDLYVTKEGHARTNIFTMSVMGWLQLKECFCAWMTYIQCVSDQQKKLIHLKYSTQQSIKKGTQGNSLVFTTKSALQLPACLL